MCELCNKDEIYQDSGFVCLQCLRTEEEKLESKFNVEGDDKNVVN